MDVDIGFSYIKFIFIAFLGTVFGERGLLKCDLILKRAEVVLSCFHGINNVTATIIVVRR